MKAWVSAFIEQGRLAHLATVDESGQPHVVPIVYGFDGVRLFTPIDEKPKRVGAYELQRVRNIRANPKVAVIIDHYEPDWEQLAWVQLRGKARIVSQGTDYDVGVGLLVAKYEQYREMPLEGNPLIVIRVKKVARWRAKGD
jgi:PPOX class probable F420-dependent enzyme